MSIGMWWQVVHFAGVVASASMLLATLLLAGVAKAVDQRTFLESLRGLGFEHAPARVVAVG